VGASNVKRGALLLYLFAAGLFCAPLRAFDSVEALYSEAQQLANEDRVEAAKGALKRALALRPDCTPAKVLLGRLLLREQRLDEAATCFFEVLAEDPTTPDALSGMEAVAAAWEARGAYRHAAAIYNTLHATLPQHSSYLLEARRLLAQKDPVEEVQRAPDSPEAQVEAGVYYLEGGECAEAENAFRRALALRPCDAKALEGMERVAALWEGTKDYAKSVAIYKDLLTCAPDNPSYLYHLGRLLAWTGERAEAIRLLRKSLALAPGQTDTQLLLGNVYLWDAQLSESEALFLDILRAHPCNAEALEGVRKVAGNYGADERALALYRTFLACDPAAFDALLPFGQLLMSLQQYAAAEEALEAAVRVRPDSTEARTALAFLYLKEGKLEQAEYAFRAVLETHACQEDVLDGLEAIAHSYEQSEPLYGRALSVYRLLLACDFHASANAFRMATLLAALGKQEEAERLLKQGAAADPESAEGQLQVGKVHMLHKEWDRAYAAFQGVLQQRPCDADALYYLERIAQEWEQERDRFESAIALYQQILTCAPNQASALYHMGRLLAWTDRLSEAEEALHRALALQPEATDIQLQLASVLLWEDKFDASADLYEKVLSRQPCLPAALEGLEKVAAVWSADPNTLAQATRLYQTLNACDPNQAEFLLRLGQVLTKAHRYREAEKALRGALALNPKSLDVQAAFADLYYRQERYKEAAAFYRNIMRQNPCDPNALTNLERIAIHWGRNQETFAAAIDVYHLLLTCAPDATDWLFALGRLLMWEHRWPEAERRLKRCLEINPADSDAMLQLAVLYIWEDRYEEADALLQEAPESTYARETMGLLEISRQNNKKAEEIFASLLQDNPDNATALYGYARALQYQDKYRASKKAYKHLLAIDPINGPARRDYFVVKQFTNPWLITGTSYTAARESDPPFTVDTVKDFYANSYATLYYPVTDKIRLSLKGFLGWQKERNLINVIRLNYNVALRGWRGGLEAFFHPDWEGELWATTTEGEQIGKGTVYPFRNATKFQPGVAIRYDRDPHFASAGYAYDDFIIKNFSITRSQFLTTRTLSGRYQYRFNIYTEPTIGVSGNKIWYEDNLHNIQWQTAIYMNLDVPLLTDYFTLFYRFDDKRFKFDSPNYYSFKKQTKETWGLSFHNSWDNRLFVGFAYQHTWQHTLNQVNPIGSFIFTAASQRIEGNRLEGTIVYRWKETLRFEVTGHTYHDNFPYKEKGFRGSLLWEF
jgi:tetratricopeptide (TPR) repeat protein